MIKSEKRFMIITFILVILAGFLLGGSIIFFGSDNPIEEAAEAIIEEQTGMEIDLTPASPES